MALLTIFYINQLLRPTYLQIADGMQQQSWYRIELAAEHIGYMTNDVYQDSDGNYHFDSTTHFQLADGAPSTITKHLHFAAIAPHHLIRASYRNRRDRQEVSVVATRLGDHYAGEVNRQGQKNTLDLQWRYTLADFLAFENWLATTPAPGERNTVKGLDFERLALTQRAFRTVERNATGYVVETNSLLEKTTTQLDANYRPIRLKMAGLFDFTQTSATDAVPKQQIRQKTHYLLPLDQRLSAYQQLSELTLRLDPSMSDIFSATLRVNTKPKQHDRDPNKFLSEELRYPIGSPSIQNLATQLNEDQPVIGALVSLVHNSLQYAQGNAGQDVLGALARGYGECTDFADLLTTVARANHLPAKTVYGLAYKDGAEPAFMFHAWNEIYHQGRWHAVDATWNEKVADATHIPLTHAQSARLMHALNTQPLKLHVIDTSYR